MGSYDELSISNDEVTMVLRQVTVSNYKVTMILYRYCNDTYCFSVLIVSLRYNHSCYILMCGHSKQKSYDVNVDTNHQRQNSTLWNLKTPYYYHVRILTWTANLHKTSRKLSAQACDNSHVWLISRERKNLMEVILGNNFTWEFSRITLISRDQWTYIKSHGRYLSGSNITWEFSQVFLTSRERAFAWGTKTAIFLLSNTW